MVKSPNDLQRQNNLLPGFFFFLQSLLTSILEESFKKLESPECLSLIDINEENDKFR